MVHIGVTEVLFILLVLPVLLLPFFAIKSILKTRFKGYDKLIWILVVLFLPVIGSILYFITGSNSKLKEW
jgi:hypothetical protein